MNQDSATAAKQARPFAGKGCPNCGYDLTGTLEPRCPECGAGFDPAKLRPVRLWRCVRWRVAVPCVLLVAYLPNTWVFWIDYPWNGYRMTWVKAFPSLPGLVAAAWVAQWTGLGRMYQEFAIFSLAGAFTALLAIPGILLARRGKRWLSSICIWIFVLEVANAYICHTLFRM